MRASISTQSPSSLDPDSAAKMALTQGPSALRSRALRIIAYETREIPHTDYYVTRRSASTDRLLCDLKFCRSASKHGIFFGLKFRLCTRNILRLKVLRSASAYRIVRDLELWNGAILLPQKKILWLGSYAVRLPYNKFSMTWSFAVPLPYKSFDFKSRSSASAERISCDLKCRSFASAQGIYYVSKFSSSAFAHRTIYDLKFLSLAQYTVTWISVVPLPQEKTSFEIPHFCFYTRTLLFFGKSTLIQTPTHFLIFVLSYMTDGSSEGQRNKGMGMLLEKSSLTFGCARHKLMTQYVHTVTVRDRVARQALRYDRENEAVLLCWHTYVNAFGRRQYMPDVKDYLPGRSIISSVRTALKRADNDETSQACLCAMG